MPSELRQLDGATCVIAKQMFDRFLQADGIVVDSGDSDKILGAWMPTKLASVESYKYWAQFDPPVVMVARRSFSSSRAQAALVSIAFHCR
jgi:hypothetical protein